MISPLCATVCVCFHQHHIEYSAAESTLDQSQLEPIRALDGSAVAERLMKQDETLSGAVAHAGRLLSTLVGEKFALLPIQERGRVRALRTLRYNPVMQRWQALIDRVEPNDVHTDRDRLQEKARRDKRSDGDRPGEQYDREMQQQRARIHHERIGRTAAETVLRGRVTGAAVLRRRKSNKREHVVSFVSSPAAAADAAAPGGAASEDDAVAAGIVHHIIKEAKSRLASPSRFSTEEGFVGYALLDVIEMLEDHYGVVFNFVQVHPEQRFEVSICAMCGCRGVFFTSSFT
jgi:hypothetical protein